MANLYLIYYRNRFEKFVIIFFRPEPITMMEPQIATKQYRTMEQFPEILVEI